jgi:hypothetical protein
VGKGGAKQQVDLYYMSIHYGICIAADAMKRVVIKEKEAWTGRVSTQTSFTINKPDLFGGKKKEGGAQGTVHWLPGAGDQVLPDALATRLGRSGGDDAPGYRGMASAFFVGSSSSSSAGSSFFSSILSGAIPSQRGFYWSANQPYLPGTWITVERAPKGLTADYRMIPRPGTFTHPYEQPTETIDPQGGFTEVAGEVVATFNTNRVEWFDLTSRQSIGWAVSSDAFFDSIWNWALADDGTAYGIGFYIDGVSVVMALYVCPVGGTYSKLTTNATIGCGPTRVFESTEGRKVMTAEPTGSTGYDDMGEHQAHAECGRDFCLDVNGDVWMISQPNSSSANFTLTRLTDTTVAFTVTGLVTRGAPNNPTFCHVSAYSHFFVVSDSKWYTIDDTTGTIKASGAFGLTTAFLPRHAPYRVTYWADFAEVSLEDASTIRSVNPSDWLAETTVGNDLYDQVNHAIWTSHSGHVTIRFLDKGELDANPAHIIYECLTNTDWGMGSPSSLIDVDSFETAGVTLFNEPLGLSLLWTKQAAIQDFVQEILNHINGVVYVDPQTGLITLTLIRGDYDPDDLPIIDQSTAMLTNFGRKLWGDIVNEINVTWTNPDNEQDETVTVQDLASIATQGGIVSDSRNYYGVRYAQLAKALAARELRSAGAPLATFQAEVDRSFYFLRPASVLKVNWPEYGLSEIVARVTSIDYGKPGDPSIKISLIEDVFGLDVGDYEDPPASAWEDPSEQPAAMTEQQAITMPYMFAANATVTLADAVYPDVLAGVFGATDSTDAYSYELWGEVTLSDGSTEWQNLTTNNILAYGELSGPLVAEAASAGVTFASLVGAASPSVPGFAIIGAGDETETEIAHLTAFSGGAYTLDRGVLDTVPRAWAAATPVWFIAEDSLIEDPTTRSAGEVAEYRLRTRTSQGLLPFYMAPLLTYTLTERPWLPSRPAKAEIGGVQFNDLATPVNMIGASLVPVSWANRNRLTEDSQVLAWTDSDVTPETDQTTTLTVLKIDGTTVLDTITGLTGTSHNIPIASFGSEAYAIVKFSASRTDADGTFDSLQAHGIYVQVDAAAPVGMATETDTARALTLAVLTAVGRANETDTALARSGTSGVAVGRADETDAALQLSAAQQDEDDMLWGPLQNEAPSSNFATLDTRNGHPCLDFDAGTAESAVFTGKMRPSYAGTGVTVTIHWAATTATSGNVMWQVAFERVDGQDTDSDGFATAQAFAAAAANGTSGTPTKSALNISNGANMDSVVAGDMYRIKITRDATNGSDTMTGDAEVMFVEVVPQ